MSNAASFAFGSPLPSASEVAARLAKYPPLQNGTLVSIKRTADAAFATSLAAISAWGGSSASGAQAKRAPCGEAAGLVPYKTIAKSSGDCEISFSKTLVAERRVNRLKRSVWASGHLHGLAEKGFRPSVPHFVTLTYAKANSWMGTHLSLAIKGYRNWCMSKGFPCRYTWVAEIQPKRLERTGEAVVHYHLLAWLPVGIVMPHWDRPTRKFGGMRSPFWSHGMTNSEIAKSGVGYLMKYLSKLGELTLFPPNLRLYGIGGLTQQGRDVRRWYNLPEWVKRSGGVGDVVKVGNAFVLRQTGEVLPPAYHVNKTPWGMVLTALRELPAKWFDGAYSSVSFA